MAGADQAADAGAQPSLDIDGAVATITLRRPAVANRLEISDLQRLLQHLAQVELDDRVRVLRLQGQGRHFCSGFNLGQVDGQAASGGDGFEAVADALESARPVTVAVLQGGAYGGAVDLALACDFRLGTPRVEMMVPAARLGLHFYRGGLERLVTRLGLPTARRLLLAADRLDAVALQSAGVLDRVVAPEALVDEAARFCAHLAGLAPLALLPMKRHLNAIARGQLDAPSLARDIARALASGDLREGALAWADKRVPRFQGR